jgi:hypothetical protein
MIEGIIEKSKKRNKAANLQLKIEEVFADDPVCLNSCLLF